MLDKIRYRGRWLLPEHSRVRVGSNGVFSPPQSLEIVVAPHDDLRSLSIKKIDCIWACTVGNENSTLDTKFVGNTGNSDSCISPRCCYHMKVGSVLRSTLLDEERYPPILERLRRLEVLEPMLVSASSLLAAVDTSSFRYASIPRR